MINRGRTFFTILLIVIAIITIALGGYLAYNYISNLINSKEASEAVEEFENSIIVVALEDEEQNPEPQVEEVVPQQTATPTKKTGTTTKYKGYTVIGTIQIPKTNVKYPIVDSPSNGAMEAAIVMLYGPGLNEVGNTVLAGHNYRNGGFFGNNKKLENGDLVYITDSFGNKIQYTIYNKYYTDDYDFSYATRDTEGRREISLSTCTSDSTKRLIIWARAN